jgi:hypothetical protein
MHWEPIHKSSRTWSVPCLPHQQHVLLADGDTDLEAGIWSLPKRLAAPMVGGVLSAMLPTLVVIPALDVIWRWYTDVKHQGGVSPVTTGVMTGTPPHA